MDDRLESAIKTIKGALRKQKNYSRDMDVAIELAAGSLVAYRIAYNDVSNLECSFVEETSRESFSRLIPHPAFKILKDANESLRRSLRELGLTIDTVKGVGDSDEIESIVKIVNDVKKGK